MEEPNDQMLFSGAGGLAFEPALALSHLNQADKVLGRWIAKIGELKWKVEESHGPYQALGVSILHQQLNGKAAEAILKKLNAALPGEGRFPSAEQILKARSDRLRKVGLSGAKVLAVKDLAARALDGTVPELEALKDMTDDAIVERLTQVRGIGRWTVEMLLIFRLGRPDVLPSDDYGVRKGFLRAFRTGELPAPRVVKSRGERWRPYRSVASWYLWRVSELPVHTRSRAK